VQNVRDSNIKPSYDVRIMHVRAANIVDIRVGMPQARRALRQVKVAIDQSTLAGRLKALRVNQGVRQEELADIIGVSRPQYSKYESGSHEPPEYVIARIADHYAVSPSFLRYGASDSRVIPVTGLVGAGAQIEAREIHSDRVVEIPASWTDATAYEVHGLSCWPIYDEHDVIVIRGEQRFNEQECLGRMCIVETVDGIGMVKRLRRGSAPGLYTLESPNAPAIEDVTLTSARPVRLHLQR
jgi:transcriptional regulator with XRE-family HTH domain